VGLYLAIQRSVEKGVMHYGMLDIGNRMGIPDADGFHPVVIHQTPPSIRWEYTDISLWTIKGKVIDEPGTLERIRGALARPDYNLLGNNCEHFVRYALLGRHESTQVNGALAVVGIAAVAFIVVNLGNAA